MVSGAGSAANYVEVYATTTHLVHSGTWNMVVLTVTALKPAPSQTVALKSQPTNHSKDCTTITNGYNLLKIYIDNVL